MNMIFWGQLDAIAVSGQSGVMSYRVDMQSLGQGLL